MESEIHYMTIWGMEKVHPSQIRTFNIKINDKEYEIRALDEDEALCTAYRKYHTGKVNVFNHILWHLGTTKENVLITEKGKE